ncbi:MAG TPA: hypothetical protein VK491_11175, partial [Gemmatimonadaceae bacterium]|nr:hypothetical protein [Gemmatimonadaceae bacterium]
TRRMIKAEAHQSAARSANGNAISGNGANIRMRKVVAATPPSALVILNIVRSVLPITTKTSLNLQS